MRKLRKPLWTLASAMVLVRRLERALTPHWHVGLTGSVLQRGESVHDLDVIIYPHCSARGVIRWPFEATLRDCGLVRTVTQEAVRKSWRARGSKDTKHVEVWMTSGGRRVDIIVLK